MEASTTPAVSEKWRDLVDQLGSSFAQRAVTHDSEATFVTQNYEELKQHGFLSAMIPKELGGKGVSHGEMCQIIQHLAFYDGSTALALSMHQHLVATNIWKYKRGKGGAELLKKVVAQQLVLVSTGAKDWLESNGQMNRVDGGFEVSAMKHFASQSIVGDILITSAPYEDPANGWQVLHFGIPMQVDGVSVLDDWYTMGMRGTGSHTVKLANVFVPDLAIVLRRPQGAYHPLWNVILTVALPLIMSAYVGIAQKAVHITLDILRTKAEHLPQIPFMVGEMHNLYTNAHVLLNDMIRITDNFRHDPTNHTGNEMLTRKTLVADLTKQTVEKCMEIVGGRSYFCNMELERLFRDVQAGVFHPLPRKSQHHFTGSFLLKQV